MTKAQEKAGAARTAILDAAEALFAQSGFDGVPVREIAKHAGVGLSLVTYHFASKEMLFEQVIERRTDVLNAMRRKFLNRFIAERDTDLTSLVEGYAEPFLILMARGDEHWKNYGELIAQVAQSRKHSGLITKHYDDTGRLFVDALLGIYPGGNRESAVRAVTYSVVVMLSIFSSIRRVESLSEGEFSSADPAQAYDSVVQFICGGINMIMAE